MIRLFTRSAAAVATMCVLAASFPVCARLAAQVQNGRPHYLTTGIFIGAIEEGARIFTPVRLLPYEHPEARGHEFPTALRLHRGEEAAVLALGRAAGLRLDATLERYPARPDTLWPYAHFAPPPGDALRAAPVLARQARETPLPGLRAVAYVDRFPVSFLVDTRGLSLAERHMRQATTMGLDLDRAAFIAALDSASRFAPAHGAAIVLFER